MDEPTRKPCKHCQRETDITKDYCEHCKCALRVKPCEVCANGIPLTADYCKECKSYQDIRRYLGGSGLIFALCLALVPQVVKVLGDYYDHHSHTSMKLGNVETDGVPVDFWNHGGDQSHLSEATLLLADTGIVGTPKLEPAENGNSIIPPKKELHVVLQLRQTLERDPKNLSDDEILRRVRKMKDVKLRCVVEESSGWHSTFTPALSSEDACKLLKPVLEVSPHG